MIVQGNLSLMGKQFLMTRSITKNGSGTMLEQMSEIGGMIDLVTLIDQETSREEGRTCRIEIFRTRA